MINFYTTKLVIILGFILSAPRVKADTPEPPNPTPQMIQSGKALFMSLCVSCHGKNGNGMGPAAEYLSPKPQDFVDNKFRFGSSPQQVFHTISKGILGTSMAGIGHISAEKRWQLAYYVLAIHHKKAISPLEKKAPSPQ